GALARTVVDAPLVHREGEHVGRAVPTHPAVVQLGHVVDVDKQHGELGEGVDPHLVEGVPGDGEHGVGVDLDTGLVGDLDGQLLSSALAAAAGPAALGGSPGNGVDA